MFQKILNGFGFLGKFLRTVADILQDYVENDLNVIPRTAAFRIPTGKPASGLFGGWQCDACGWWNQDLRQRCRNCHKEKMPVEPPVVTSSATSEPVPSVSGLEAPPLAILLDDYERANLIAGLDVLKRLGLDTGDWFEQIRGRMPLSPLAPNESPEKQFERLMTSTIPVDRGIGDLRAGRKVENTCPKCDGPNPGTAPDGTPLAMCARCSLKVCGSNHTFLSLEESSAGEPEKKSKKLRMVLRRPTEWGDDEHWDRKLMAGMAVFLEGIGLEVSLVPPGAWSPGKKVPDLSRITIEASEVEPGLGVTDVIAFLTYFEALGFVLDNFSYV